MKKDIKRFLNPPKKEKLHENITAQLRDLIHSKKLALDDKLPSERELANILGVSRVVVRESIQSLEQAGLIEIRTGPTGGAFIVQKLDKPVFLAASDMFKGGDLTLQHFYEARKAIETAIIRITVEKVKHKDIEVLKTLNKILLAEIDDKVNPNGNVDGAIGVVGTKMSVPFTNLTLSSRSQDSLVKGRYTKKLGFINNPDW